MKGRKGDGLVFTLSEVPARLFRPISTAQAIFRITQEYISQAFFTSSTSVQTFNNFAATVNLLDQISHLTAIFDQYRIPMLEIWLVPQRATTNTCGSNVASVIDYDDNTNLTTYAQALDYVNCVSTEGRFAHYRKFVPHCAVAIYSGAFTSYENVTAPWIDAASTGVLHYGIKVASTQASAVTVYDLTVRLHTEWRNVR